MVGVECGFADQRPIGSGLPQGPVLSPFLFVVYIDNLDDCILNTSRRSWRQAAADAGLHKRTQRPFKHPDSKKSTMHILQRCYLTCWVTPAFCVLSRFAGDSLVRSGQCGRTSKI